jgi:hypothetical protein
MSSLTYPEVGPTVPIQDISPVVAGVVSPSGFHPAQHAANTIAGAESALSEAYNWVLQQIGLESPPTQNLP